MSEVPGMLRLLTMISAVAAMHADIRPLLRAQGFEGWLNRRETIKYVGEIREGRNAYQIYLYRGLFRAAVVDHGVNDMFVVRNGTKVLGHYHISMPITCKIRTQKVVCKSECQTEIVSTKLGPPQRIWFDCEVITFDLRR